MSERNTLVRSLHDVGLAAWFGGSLMGAVGLNGAAAVVTHAIGGLGLIGGNKARLGAQSGARGNTVVKAALTAAAVGATAYSGLLGRKVSRLSHQGAAGATEPASTSSPELASAQKQLRITQWGIPALTGTLVVLGAQQGEQQRPVAGLFGR
jgi:hypothetical protein